jgi:hypothetical protein
VVTYLKAQHEEIKTLFEKVLSADGGEALDSRHLARMKTAAEFAELTAPTRPHPGVESATANLLVGPFAAMLDRARDLLTGKS